MNYPTWRELREHINAMQDINLDDNISLHCVFNDEYYTAQKITIADDTNDVLDPGATVIVFGSEEV